MNGLTTKRPRWTVVILLAAALPAAAGAQARPDAPAAASGHRLLRPIVLGSLGVVLTGFADHEIRTAAQENGGPSMRATGRGISRWSPPLALGLGAGLWGAGLVMHQAALAHTGRDALVAIGAAGFLTAAAKVAVGRARPEANRGTDDFAPFGSLTYDSSFPSGHTSQAFALAAVIAGHTRRPAIRITAFSAATVVGIARIAADRHFASDVVGGALLGTLVGRAVVHHFAAGTTHLTIAPIVAPGRIGLMIGQGF